VCEYCALFLRLFTEEPVDFVRKVHDPLGDWLSPLIAATNLLQVGLCYSCMFRVVAIAASAADLRVVLCGLSMIPI
jgi:hypothetical protein